MKMRNRLHLKSYVARSRRRGGQSWAANSPAPAGRFRFSYDDNRYSWLPAPGTPATTMADDQREQAARKLRAAAAQDLTEEQRQRIRAATRC